MSGLRVVTMSMWPSAITPEFGVFVRGQVSALRKLGADVHVAKLIEQRSGKLRTPAKYLRLSRHTRELIRDHDPEVLHGHYLLPMGFVTRRLAKQFSIPYVVTAHGSDVAGAERSGRVRARTEDVVRDAAAVIVVSDELAMRLRKLYPGIDPVVSHMGIDTDLFHWNTGPSAQPAQGPLIVAVGSLNENKNHARLIDAVGQLADVRLVIIGEGPARSSLQARIDAGSLGDRIALAGRVPLYELPAWFVRADVCTLISLREGFGLSALEGAACGARPVVSTTAPLARVVAHSGGVVVDPVDAEAITTGLRHALDLGRLSKDASAAITHDQDTVSRARVVLSALSLAATS